LGGQLVYKESLHHIILLLIETKFNKLKSTVASGRNTNSHKNIVQFEDKILYSLNLTILLLTTIKL